MHELMEWDWVHGPADDHELLHHLADHTWDEDDCFGPGTSACNIEGTWSIPGFGSRMGSMRCAACCTATGYPHGKGSPKNDDRCRPLVEAKLAAAPHTRPDSWTEAGR